jgi:adenine phosphoribosyltransferase
LIDDLLATGGTAVAAIKLLKALDAEIVGISFLIELAALNGRNVLGHSSIQSLLCY